MGAAPNQWKNKGETSSAGGTAAKSSAGAAERCFGVQWKQRGAELPSHLQPGPLRQPPRPRQRPPQLAKGRKKKKKKKNCRRRKKKSKQSLRRTALQYRRPRAPHRSATPPPSWPHWGDLAWCLAGSGCWDGDRVLGRVLLPGNLLCGAGNGFPPAAKGFGFPPCICTVRGGGQGM